MPRFLTLALAALWVAGPLHAQCLSNADTAATIRQSVDQAVTLTDSTTLVNQGIPYKPTGGATLVTSTQVCSKVVTALNTGLASSDPRRVSSAYVFKVGQSTYAGVGNKTTVDSLVFTFLDSKYKWLASMAAMN